MGKSLSIIAITTQCYNINGWSIWPPHLALGDDVKLPIAMEHLRPYLRKRKGPIIAPPGLRHNQRYYPKSLQSRQLLMDNKLDKSNKEQSNLADVQTPKKIEISHQSFSQSQSDSHDSKHTIPQTSQHVDISSSPDTSSNSQLSSSMNNDNSQSLTTDDEIRLIDELVILIKEDGDGENLDFSAFESSFVELFKKVIQNPDESDIGKLRDFYQKNRFDQFMVEFINHLVREIREKNLQNLQMASMLQKVTSITRSKSRVKITDEAKLVITLESLSQDIIMADADSLWKYGIFHDLLYPLAARGRLVPSEQPMQRYLNKPLGIIPFDGSNIEYKYKFKTDTDFMTYMHHIRNMIDDDEKYPFLKDPAAYPARVYYIRRVCMGLTSTLEVTMENLPEFAAQLIKESFTGFYKTYKSHPDFIKGFGEWLAENSLAKAFLPNDRVIINSYLFNLDWYNEITDKRTFVSEWWKYLYSFSFVSQEIMHGLTKTSRNNVIIWMYKHLFTAEKRKEFVQREKERGQRLFGWIIDIESMHLSESVEFNGLDFNQYIEYLMDIENWENKNYELQTNSFNVPYLNTLKFKAEYLVKVLNDAQYNLKKYRVQNDRDARVIITVQNVLNQWYDEYVTHQSMDGIQNWSPSPKVYKSIIKEIFTKDLLEQDYTDMIKDSAFRKCSLSEDALNYFFEE